MGGKIFAYLKKPDIVDCDNDAAADDDTYRQWRWCSKRFAYVNDHDIVVDDDDEDDTSRPWPWGRDIFTYLKEHSAVDGDNDEDDDDDDDTGTRASSSHEGHSSVRADTRASRDPDSYLDPEARLRQLQRTNQRLRQRQTCRICRASLITTIFLPCGHLCTCTSCAASIDRCCLCGERIVGTALAHLNA